MTAELSIIVPTFSERGNVGRLHDALKAVLVDCSWELVFVDDDSPDGTIEAVWDIAAADPRVRGIQRLGRRGLASACIEGILSTSSPYVCVMDADLQHDESIIPAMLERLKSGTADVVIGSRYVASGSTGELSRMRVWISQAATLMCRLATGVRVSDPMSGFFMLTRGTFNSVMRRLSGRGFKILLDILASSREPLRCEEIPYAMRVRMEGESKLSTGVVWDYLVMLMHKAAGRLFPSRFISFATVGLSGVAVNLFVLWLLHRLLTAAFVPAQAIATVIAMTSNYVLNNTFTYRERRLRGVKFLRGLISFYLACFLGALINVALAGWLFETGVTWWLAGMLGAVAGAVWNYAITAMFTWKEPVA